MGIRWIAWVVTLLAGVLLPATCAWASCTGNATLVTEVTLPASLAIPRNNGWSAGTVLWTSGWIGPERVDVRNCEPATDRQIWSYAQARTPTPGSAYATTLRGIGVQVAWLPALSPVTFGAPPSRIISWPPTLRALDSSAPDFSLPSHFQIRLVKTGPVDAGVLQFAAPLAYIAFGSARVAELHVGGSTVVSLSSCVTPNVAVDLGNWDASRLQVSGSRTPAVPFKLDMRDCPAGLNGISYRFLSNEARVEPGVIGPRLAGSSATGIGVRVSLPDDTPLLLSRLHNVIYINGGEPVNDVRTGGDYIIPLQASLYRLPDTTLNPGTITSELEFSMFYE